MIEGSVFKFGYGDVLISASGFDTLKFCQCRPPFEVGYQLTKDDVYESVERIEMKLTIKEINLLRALADLVDKDNPIFMFKGYIFDYSNYNPKSVESLMKCLNFLINKYTQLSAC